MMAPSGKPVGSVTIHVLKFGALPAGASCGVQPSSPLSKDVVPSPVETSMSSANTPSPWNAQPPTYVIDTSTCCPENPERSTCHCSQPPEFPLDAFHTPVVPCGSQSSPTIVW